MALTADYLAGLIDAGGVLHQTPKGSLCLTIRGERHVLEVVQRALRVGTLRHHRGHGEHLYTLSFAGLEELMKVVGFLESSPPRSRLWTALKSALKDPQPTRPSEPKRMPASRHLRERAIALYREGYSLKMIEDETGYTTPTILKWVKEAGLMPNRRRRWGREEKERFLRACRRMADAQVAELFNLSVKTVRAYRRRWGVKKSRRGAEGRFGFRLNQV
jgi:transposase-like protein